MRRKGNQYSNKLELGNNGIVVISNRDNPDSSNVASYRTAEYLIYSIAEDRWTRLPNPVLSVGIPAVAVGNKEPVFAVAGYDQVLRVYDQSKDGVIKEYELPVPASSVFRMQFLMEDRLLVILQNSPDTVTFVDLEDGRVLGQFHPGYVSKITCFQIDEKSNRLYVTVSDGKWNGLCIDMDTWSVVAEIPGLLCLIPGTDRIVQMDFLYTGLTIRPLRTLDQLLEESRQLLELHTPAQVP